MKGLIFFVLVLGLLISAPESSGQPVPDQEPQDDDASGQPLPDQETQNDGVSGQPVPDQEPQDDGVGGTSVTYRGSNACIK